MKQTINFISRWTNNLNWSSSKMLSTGFVTLRLGSIWLQAEQFASCELKLDQSACFYMRLNQSENCESYRIKYKTFIKLFVLFVLYFNIWRCYYSKFFHGLSFKVTQYFWILWVASVCSFFQVRKWEKVKWLNSQYTTCNKLWDLLL